MRRSCRHKGESLGAVVGVAVVGVGVGVVEEVAGDEWW